VCRSDCYPAPAAIGAVARVSENGSVVELISGVVSNGSSDWLSRSDIHACSNGCSSGSCGTCSADKLCNGNPGTCCTSLRHACSVFSMLVGLIRPRIVACRSCFLFIHRNNAGLFQRFLALWQRMAFLFWPAAFFAHVFNSVG